MYFADLVSLGTHNNPLKKVWLAPLSPFYRQSGWEKVRESHWAQWPHLTINICILFSKDSQQGLRETWWVIISGLWSASLEGRWKHVMGGPAWVFLGSSTRGGPGRWLNTSLTGVMADFLHLLASLEQFINMFTEALLGTACSRRSCCNSSMGVRNN